MSQKQEYTTNSTRSNYFNCDLSEYINTLPRVMTSIDMDIWQTKMSKQTMRFIEFKHINEKIGTQQHNSLKQLAYMARIINDNPVLFHDWEVEVMLIRGEKPFDELFIYDYVKNKNIHLTQKDEIDSFLTFEP